MEEQLPWTGERIVTSIYWELAAEHLARYAFAMDFCKGKKVLDAACGEGYGTAILADVALEAFGVDIDTETINHANRKYKKQNTHFVTADVCKLPFPDSSFDVIISFETLEHVNSYQELLKEFKRVLVPGGLLFISTPDKQHYSVDRKYCNPFHTKEFFSAEFLKVMNDYFANAEMFCQQNFMGSIVYSSNPRKALPIESSKRYHGLFTSIREDESLKKPLYRIVIASDSSLPDMNNLFFQDKKLLQNLTEHAENTYRNTTSYRLGNAIIKPFARMKDLFKKAYKA